MRKKQPPLLSVKATSLKMPLMKAGRALGLHKAEKTENGLRLTQEKKRTWKLFRLTLRMCQSGRNMLRSKSTEVRSASRDTLKRNQSTTSIRLNTAQMVRHGLSMIRHRIQSFLTICLLYPLRQDISVSSSVMLLTIRTFLCPESVSLDLETERSPRLLPMQQEHAYLPRKARYPGKRRRMLSDTASGQASLKISFITASFSMGRTNTRSTSSTRKRISTTLPSIPLKRTESQKVK